MSRPKNTFKENTQLQTEILNDRLINCLTIREISVKYSQYSEITYKRFFAMVLGREESKEIQKRARRRLRKYYSQIQKDRLKKS